MLNLDPIRQSNARRRQSRRCRFESLERRELMAIDIFVTNTDDAGPGSLRDAIEVANESPGRDSIKFSLLAGAGNRMRDVDSGLSGGDNAADVFVIELESPLPELTDEDGTRILGTHQTRLGNINPFGPEIVLDGRGIRSDGSGLMIQGDNNEIRGLTIQNFRNSGIEITGDFNRIDSNYLGTDATGRSARPNGHGLTLHEGSNNNRIGSTSSGNLLSGNRYYGMIMYSGSDADSVTSQNMVFGNRIGADATGDRDLPNNVGIGLPQVYEATLDESGNRISDNQIRSNRRGAYYASSMAMQKHDMTDNEISYLITYIPGYYPYARSKLVISGAPGDDTINVSSNSRGEVFVNGEKAPHRLGFFSEIVIHGSSGDDVINAHNANYAWATISIHGGSGNDTITGSRLRRDTIRGGSGNDTIRGGGGHDRIYGGSGEDQLIGGPGNDYLDGGTNNDELFGRSGNDTLKGSFGNDRLYGESGRDSLFGGHGDDGLFAGLKSNAGRETVDGGRGYDRILTHEKNARIEKDHLDAHIHFFDREQRWTEREIQVMDSAFGQLQDRSRGSWILKDTLTGDPLSIVKFRGKSDGSSPVGVNRETFNILTGFNRTIKIQDWNEYSDAQSESRVSTMIHEIAHNWDGSNYVIAKEKNPFWSQFKTLNRHSRTIADFAEDYGRTNVWEDWATSWQFYFDLKTPTSTIMQQKLDLVDGFLTSQRIGSSLRMHRLA